MNFTILDDVFGSWIWPATMPFRTCYYAWHPGDRLSSTIHFWGPYVGDFAGHWLLLMSTACLLIIGYSAFVSLAHVWRCFFVLLSLPGVILFSLDVIVNFKFVILAALSLQPSFLYCMFSSPYLILIIPAQTFFAVTSLRNNELLTTNGLTIMRIWGILASYAFMALYVRCYMHQTAIWAKGA
jgi:hypothetical protein